MIPWHRERGRPELLGRSLFPGRLMGACYCDSVVGPRSCVGLAHVTSADTWLPPTLQGQSAVDHHSCLRSLGDRAALFRHVRRGGRTGEDRLHLLRTPEGLEASGARLRTPEAAGTIRRKGSQAFGEGRGFRSIQRTERGT